jgi:hypothetical protein
MRCLTQSPSKKLLEPGAMVAAWWGQPLFHVKGLETPPCPLFTIFKFWFSTPFLNFKPILNWFLSELLNSTKKTPCLFSEAAS